MFNKTQDKLREKYIKPAQTGIAFAVVMSVLAFVLSMVAFAMAIPTRVVTPDAV